MSENKFEPVEAEGNKKKKGFFSQLPGIVLVVIIFGGMYLFGSHGENGSSGSKSVAKQTVAKSWKEEDNSFSALYYVQHYHIEPRLKAPSTAKFASLHDDGTTVVKDGVSYEIVSYVDSQNSFGAMLRKYYIAKVTQGGENLWRVDAFSWVE